MVWSVKLLATGWCASSEARRARSVMKPVSQAQGLSQLDTGRMDGALVQERTSETAESNPEVAVHGHVFTEHGEGAVSEDEIDPEFLAQTADDSNMLGKVTADMRGKATEHRRRSLYKPGEYPKTSGSTIPFMASDVNPIGLGTIPGAFGLMVMVFAPDRTNLLKADLKSVVISRRFPSSFRRRRAGGLIKVQVSNRPSARSKPSSGVVSASYANINFIICPFLSTLVNEGALQLKQKFSRGELTDATNKAGLDPDVTDEHVEDNFENNKAGVFDIWNLEGETDEHQTSTGINDCQTSFRSCEGAEGSRTRKCIARTPLRTSCALPNKEMFEQFFKAVDANNNGNINIEELNTAADRSEILRVYTQASAPVRR